MVNQNDLRSPGEAERDTMCTYYEERRKDLEEIRSDSMDSFDRAILQVSTGALLITITFIDKIGKPYDNFTNKLLIIFWSLFLAVILINIFSYYSAKKNMDFKIRNLDERFEKCPENWTNIPETFSKFKRCTEVCNQLALWCFILGAFLFFTYAYMVQNYNFQKKPKEEIAMTDKKKPVDEGKTESSEKIVPLKKGQTETPEKVIKPVKPKEK